jgi:DNA-directed RNA polymerase beta subunit
MCNGTTGMPLEALITMGPTFYQRLDHMVEDKIKFRGIGGSINPLTHQPVRDRNSLGGVKFGEMERDCMLGHGASSTLRITHTKVSLLQKWQAHCPNSDSLRL